MPQNANTGNRTNACRGPANRHDVLPPDSLDVFALDHAEEDDFLDRQLFAIRESLADFRSL